MTTACSGPRCTEKCDDLDIDILKTKSSLTGPYATVTGYDYAVPACASGACNNQNMTLLAQNIASHGPASICVNAANWSKYEGGVMSTSACGGFAADDLDHSVQLTGYNADAHTPYWIVRNSWATDWGQNGYIYLSIVTYSFHTCKYCNTIHIRPSQRTYINNSQLTIGLKCNTRK